MTHQPLSRISPAIPPTALRGAPQDANPPGVARPDIFSPAADPPDDDFGPVRGIRNALAIMLPIYAAAAWWWL